MLNFIERLKKAKKHIQRELIHSFLGDDVGGEIASGILHKMNEFFGLHSIASFLPFQFYYAESELYHMDNSKGMFLEATPMIGATDDNAEVFYNLLQRVLPEGTIVQFLLYASPNIGVTLDQYIHTREHASEILKRNAEKRVEFFKKGVFKSLIPGQQHVLRDYQLYITLVFDNTLEISELNMQSYRNRLVGTLKGMGVSTAMVQPVQFLQLIDSLLRPKEALNPHDYHWDELKPLAKQLVNPEYTHKVTSKRIIVNENDFEIRNFRVADFPKRAVHLYEMRDLIGDLFDDNCKIGCPFSLSFIIKICYQNEERRIAQIRAPRANQRAMMIGRISPKAIEEAIDARVIVKQIEDFERLVLVDFQVSLYYKKNEGDEHEATLMNVFQAPVKKWRLIKNHLLQLTSLLAHLPLAQSHLLFNEL